MIQMHNDKRGGPNVLKEETLFLGQKVGVVSPKTVNTLVMMHALLANEDI